MTTVDDDEYGIVLPFRAPRRWRIFGRTIPPIEWPAPDEQVADVVSIGRAS